jgi:tetratricopeptide (TPR) repeat protein
VLSSLLTSPAAFRRETVLKPDVVASFMDSLDKGRPALKATTTQVRSGRFDGAARQAFDAGDQLAAAFLRGLELFAKGEINPAATQFSAALRIDPRFAPASFYLGACYAIGGRDKEAMTQWSAALQSAEKARSCMRRSPTLCSVWATSSWPSRHCATPCPRGPPTTSCAGGWPWRTL